MTPALSPTYRSSVPAGSVEAPPFEPPPLLLVLVLEPPPPHPARTPSSRGRRVVIATLLDKRSLVICVSSLRDCSTAKKQKEALLWARVQASTTACN